MIVNNNSSVISKLSSLTDAARVIIYDRNVFIIQAAGYELMIKQD